MKFKPSVFLLILLAAVLLVSCGESEPQAATEDPNAVQNPATGEQESDQSEASKEQRIPAMLIGVWKLERMQMAGIDMIAEEIGDSRLEIREEGLMITRAPELEPITEKFNYVNGYLEVDGRSEDLRIESLDAGQLMIITVGSEEPVRYVYLRVMESDEQ